MLILTLGLCDAWLSNIKSQIYHQTDAKFLVYYNYYFFAKYFRPLVFTFAVETDDFIQCEEKKLIGQIENLQDMSFSVGQEHFSLHVRLH
jgi:hypothetical protein